MATSEEIEKYCRNCVSRDFVNGKGLVCKRTGELPAFEEECDSFEQDKELERLAPPKPEDFPVFMTEEEMLAEENLPKGILCAVVACIVGAVAWGLISVSTGRQIGFMPIAHCTGGGAPSRSADRLPRSPHSPEESRSYGTPRIFPCTRSYPDG